MADTAIFDVDGTLVDTSYWHTVAWDRAFRRHEVVCPMWQIHRTIGMGGDQLVAHLAGSDVESDHGDDVRTAFGEEYDLLIHQVQPFPGVRELLLAVKERGFRVVLASSGKAEHVEASLALFGGQELADAWTTADDAERSKPEPDLLLAALDRVGGTGGVVVGDATWDCLAAGKVDMPCVGLRTGGLSGEELYAAGAVQVFDSLRDLLENLGDTPLAKADPGA